jgi:hypothetical protein
MKNDKNAHGKSNHQSTDNPKKADTSKGGLGNNSNQQGNASKSNANKMDKAAQESKQHKK